MCFQRCIAAQIFQSKRAWLVAQAARLHHAPQVHGILAQSHQSIVDAIGLPNHQSKGTRLRRVAGGPPALPAIRTSFAVPSRDAMKTTQLHFPKVFRIFNTRDGREVPPPCPVHHDRSGRSALENNGGKAGCRPTSGSGWSVCSNPHSIWRRRGNTGGPGWTGPPVPHPRGRRRPPRAMEDGRWASGIPCSSSENAGPGID